MKLCNAALETIDENVAVPQYDRSKVTAGIVHVGVGNFHRSHMATYIDDLLATGEANEWGIVGSGVMHFDHDKRTLLEKQDWMQTLVERDGENVSARVIGSMIDFLPVEPKNHSQLYNKLLEPGIKIVSLTVTEGGYFLSDGKFDALHPSFVHDSDMANTDKLVTIFAVIVKALKARKEKGLAPFTCMSCDNVPHNGDIIKSVVLGLARLSDPLFGDWIEENVAFPNSMVDRITPATSADEIEYLQQKFGVEDAAPVFCEPFRQWVLEDKFSNGRPPLEKVGVTFVPDVTPYETMKIRILNGGHAALCYPSALLGVKYVHEAMEHPTIGPFLDTLEKNEIIPTVPEVPDTNLEQYWETIGKRFSNPTICDTINRNCYDGYNRQPKFVVPVAKQGLKNGTAIDGMALVSAMWCRYVQGKREDGSTVEANDPIWDELQERALKAAASPKIWLEMKEVYGDLGTEPAFVEAFTKALQSIQSNGIEGAMQNYIDTYGDTSRGNAKVQKIQVAA